MKKSTPLKLRKRLADTFTYSEAKQAGLSDVGLYSMRDRLEVVQIARGLYRWADSDPADIDLIEITARLPRATLCLETALARHRLTDIIPSAIDVAIPRGAHRPSFYAPCRLHVFASDTFNIGRELIDVGAPKLIGLYSAERSIIDVIRLRHKEGSDVAWEALRRWLMRPGSSPGSLLRLAKRFRGAETALQKAFEILL